MIPTDTAHRKVPANDHARRPGGFTLVELMVTLFVAAVLMAIAIPSFRHIISSTGAGAASNELLAALRYARTEAVTRGSQVAVNASTSGEWEDGWSVVAVATSAGGTDTVLRRHGALKAGYNVLALPDNTVRMAFNPQGVTGQRTVLTLADTDTASRTESKVLVIEPSGAIYSCRPPSHGTKQTLETPCRKEEGTP